MRGIGRRALGTAALSAAVLGALLFPAPARAELLVNISKSQQRLAVTLDGTELYRWPVSTGRRGHDTPAGKFRPVRLERHWYSRQFSLTPMPWAMFFHRGYAVHGTMESYNLGHAASHGCVRLRPDNASILYSLIRHQGNGNTQIVVMNGPLPPPAAAPGAVPMADAATPAADKPVELAAKTSSGDGNKAGHGSIEHLSAKAQLEPAALPKRAVHAVARIDDGSFAAGDEASVMRGRQAWLRSLDRKYGFTR